MAIKTNGYTIRDAKAADIDDLVRFRLRLQEHVEKGNGSLWGE